MLDCAKNGFAKERIEAVLHQFEIDQKHRSGTFGMNLLFRVYTEGSTPIYALEIDRLLDNIRDKVLSETRYFEGLIQRM